MAKSRRTWHSCLATVAELCDRLPNPRCQFHVSWVHLKIASRTNTIGACPRAAVVPVHSYTSWVWVKLSHPGTAGFTLLFHLPGSHFWVPIFDPQPVDECLDHSRVLFQMRTAHAAEFGADIQQAKSNIGPGGPYLSGQSC